MLLIFVIITAISGCIAEYDSGKDDVPSDVRENDKTANSANDVESVYEFYDQLYFPLMFVPVVSLEGEVKEELSSIETNTSSNLGDKAYTVLDNPQTYESDNKTALLLRPVNNTNDSEYNHIIFNWANKIDVLQFKRECLVNYYNISKFQTDEGYKLWLDSLKDRTDCYINNSFDAIDNCRNCKIYLDMNSSEYGVIDQYEQWLRTDIINIQKGYDNSEIYYYMLKDGEISSDEFIENIDKIGNMLTGWSANIIQAFVPNEIFSYY